jgi:parvulin-like peptidyl-prolyl isomerase
MIVSRMTVACLCLSLFLVVFGCSSESPVDSTATDTTDQPPAPGEQATGEVPDELSAAHILIMHKDSERVPETITRTKEEALVLAQEVATKAQADGADFAALAKEYSDGPSGPNGGDLGNFAPQMMVPPFTGATLKLAVGEVSAPVETEFGYHVIRRQEVKEIPVASAKHILVMYAGSMRAPGNITRTKEEALTRMNECLERAKKGDKFEDLATEYSDCPSAAQGGDLGEFPKGVMAPTFDEAVFNGDVGKLTGIVETPFGYHIIFRYQ